MGQIPSYNKKNATLNFWINGKLNSILPEITVPFDFCLKFPGCLVEMVHIVEIQLFFGFFINFPRTIIVSAICHFKSSRIFGWMESTPCDDVVFTGNSGKSCSMIITGNFWKFELKFWVGWQVHLVLSSTEEFLAIEHRHYRA